MSSSREGTRLPLFEIQTAAIRQPMRKITQNVTEQGYGRRGGENPGTRTSIEPFIISTSASSPRRALHVGRSSHPKSELRPSSLLQFHDRTCSSSYNREQTEPTSSRQTTSRHPFRQPPHGSEIPEFFEGCLLSCQFRSLLVSVASAGMTDAARRRHRHRSRDAHRRYRPGDQGEQDPTRAPAVCRRCSASPGSVGSTITAGSRRSSAWRCT